jgi:hypothetical protein
MATAMPVPRSASASAWASRTSGQLFSGAGIQLASWTKRNGSSSAPQRRRQSSIMARNSRP